MSVAELDEHIATAIAAVLDGQAHEHDHGLGTTATRKLPGDALRALRRWREASAAGGATLCDKSGANGTAERAARAGTK